MRYFHLPAVALTLLSLAACAPDSTDIFVGCYAARPDAQARVQIGKQAERYTIAVLTDGQWSEDFPMHTGSAEELSGLFGDKAAHVKSSIIADEGSLALFHVDPRGMQSESEYHAVLLLVAGDVYRVACP